MCLFYMDSTVEVEICKVSSPRIAMSALYVYACMIGFSEGRTDPITVEFLKFLIIFTTDTKGYSSADALLFCKVLITSFAHNWIIEMRLKPV